MPSPLPHATPPLSAPFGKLEEHVSSTRYLWRNSDRGAEPFVIVQLTLGGVGRFVLRGRPHAVPAGHALVAVVPESSEYLFPPDAREPWRFAWLNFYGPLAVTLARTTRDRHGPVPALRHGSAAHSGFVRLIHDVSLRQARDPWEHSTTCYGFWMDWWRALDEPANDDPVAAAMRICQARFRERLGVKEIAADIGITREHLTRLFVAQTGRAPAAYLRALRVQAARPMLDSGRLPAREIALRCGFPSVRALRAATG